MGNLSTAFVQDSYINVIPSSYYTLSTTNDYSSDANFRIQICEYDENKTFIKRNNGTYNTGVRTSYTIQLEANTKYIRIGGMNNLIDELQLEKKLYCTQPMKHIIIFISYKSTSGGKLI